MNNEQKNITEEIKQIDKESLSAVDLRVINFLPVADDKFILDACCGGRMMWFDKRQQNTVYIDNRSVEKGHIQHGYNPGHCVEPDYLMDFRDMKFADKTFKLIFFDPPHAILNENSIIAKKYGTLDELHWGYDIKRGLEECWRVLDDYGVLLFKWNDVQIPHKKVLELIDFDPLVMNIAKEKAAKEGNVRSYWFTYMKIPDRQKDL